MIFIPVFVALLIDHLWPMRTTHFVTRAVRALTDRIERGFNAGHTQQGRYAWLILVTGLGLLTLIIYQVCLYMNVLLALAFKILVLYLCMGFRQASQQFSSVQLALIAGDESKARDRLKDWSGKNTELLDSPEIIQFSIEKALVTSHRHIFGVFFWFMIPFVGTALAVVYRLSAHLASAWSENPDMEYANFGKFAGQAFYVLDWIPARLTAIGFAIAGNFEDAAYTWRNFATLWENGNTGVLISAGAGALGVRLGTPRERGAQRIPDSVDGTDPDVLEMDLLPGEEPSLRFFQTTIGLIWRVLLLWLLFFLSFTVISWID